MKRKVSKPVWIFILASVLLLGLVTTIKGQGVGLPYKSVPDTRVIDSLSVDSLPREQMRRWMSTLHENGGCLYGHVKVPVLSIDSVSQPSHVWFADSSQVGFACEHSDKFVGIVHTHIIPNSCWHSEPDNQIVMSDDRILVSYILCVEGIGEIKLKDGRFAWFRWRK